MLLDMVMHPILQLSVNVIVSSMFVHPLKVVKHKMIEHLPEWFILKSEEVD